MKCKEDGCIMTGTVCVMDLKICGEELPFIPQKLHPILLSMGREF
jgi:hypothetical protein